MSIKMSLVVLAIGMVAQSITGNAYGWGVGGSIRSDFKTVFNDRDLYCDLSDPRSNANVDAKIDPLQFTFQGQVVCWEVNNGFDVQDVTQERKFLFNLVQWRMVGGLEVSECRRGATTCADGDLPPTGDIEKRTTWVFRVKQGAPNADLLWRLYPANDDAVKEFCKDQDGHPISTPYCGVNFGLDEHEKATSTSGIPDGGGDGERASDYPARDLAGDPAPDLMPGEIFRFSTQTSNGVEEAKDLFWAPCHSGQYSIFAFPGCEFRIGPGSAKKTIVKGKGRGKPHSESVPAGKG